MHGRVALDDEVFVREGLEFGKQRTVTGLERLGDFGVDAERDRVALELAFHLPHLGEDFIANRGGRLHPAGSLAVVAGLAECAFEGLLDALARDGNQAEIVEGDHFRRGAVGAQGLFQGLDHFISVAPLVHINEIHHHDAAQVPQPDLADNFRDRVHIGFDDGVLEPAGLADVLSGVHVNGHQGLRLIDDDVSAGLKPNLRLERLFDLGLDAELLEHRRFTRKQLDVAN